MKKLCKNIASNNALALHPGRKGHSTGRVVWIAAALIAVVVLFASVPANAQIGASLVTSIADGTDTSSYNFPSATYSNNVLYIAFTSTACASTQNCGLGVDQVAAVASVSGAGLNFTEIGPAGGQVFSTDGRRIQAWRALATSGATTGAVTVTMQTGTISASMGAAIIEFTGTKTSGTNGADAVVQWPSIDGGYTNSLTVTTMNAFADPNNRPVAFFSHRAQSGTEATTHDTAEGYTELYDGPHGSVMMADMAEWHDTAANTTPSASWTSTGDTGGFALEIAIASDTLTLANHTSGQVSDKFTTTSPVTDVLYRFNLTRSGTVTVNTLRVNFTTIGGVANGDVTNGELWEDVDNDGVVDNPGDTLLQGSVTPSGGVLTFDNNFTPGTSGTNYLVRATVSNLVAGDTTTLSVGTTDIDEVEGGVTESGSITNATHAQDNPATNLYRSVGATATDLNYSGPNPPRRTVEIAGSTATFSDIMPDNVGVGDVLVYNSGGNQLAFIHGRISSTVYTVKDKAGGVPTAASAGTDVGVYRAYTSLANWESQTENPNITEPTENDVNPSTNLVSADTVMMVACYGDGPDTTSVSINGWTTGDNNYIKIYTPVSSSEVGKSQRHNGKWDDSKYRINAPSSHGVYSYSGAGHVRIDGLQIWLQTITGNGNGCIGAYQATTGAADYRISNNICRGASNDTYDYYGINIYDTGGAGSVARIWNNIVYDFEGTRVSPANGAGIYLGDGDFTGYVYNNTVYNCRIGFYRSVGTFVAKNNIAYNNSDNYSGTFDTASSNNLSGPFQADAPGSDPRNEATVTFVDPTGSPPDFHLHSSITDAHDYGANLSSDPNLSFFDDIDGHTRSGTWDIGADEQELTVYGYRKQITIDKDQLGVSCGSDLTNFPFMIKIENDGDLRTTANGGHVQNSNGYDIIFKDSNNNLLSHEVEEYDGTNGTLIAWVRIPTLSSTNDTTIYLYYGNKDITSPTENPAWVWDSNYALVWHLEETVTDEDNQAGAHIDSTANNNDGDQHGNDDLAGKIWTGQDFDAVDDYIEGTSNAFSTQAGTVDFWIKPNWNGNDGPTVHALYIHQQTDWNTNAIWIKKEFDNTLRFWVADDSALDYRLIYTDISGWLAGEWHHIVVSWDSSLTLKMYLDGSEISPTSYDEGTPGLPTALGPAFTMGGYPGTGGELDGTLDEVRISTVARDACQIETEHKNQGSPSSFYTVGGEQDLSKFTYRKEITIDKDQLGTSCSSDLTNYPLMINIQNDSDLRTTANGGYVQNSNGYDIIFRASDGVTQLDHEIENYDGSTGTLVAWVRIPVLSATSDTTIYMYYGNAAITSPTENPAGVWDSSYKGVWHLSEDPTDPSPAFKDSTPNNNDGTDYGSMTSGDQVPGQIDGSLDFDGGDDYLEADDSSSLRIPGSFTVSAWINTNDLPAVDDLRSVVGKGMSSDDPGENHNYGIMLENDILATGNAIEVYYEPSTGFGNAVAASWETSLNTGEWYHVVGVHDADADTLTLFVNGVQRAQNTGATATPDTGNTPLRIADVNVSSPPYTNEFNGQIDEVRISNVARDACWIETDHSNQNAPTTFYSVGGQENLQAYAYSKEITIDFNRVGASCGSDLTDFPVLVSISGDNDLKTAPTGHVESSNGYDIIFKDSDGNPLDHEVEQYDGSAGSLVAWVKVPVLSQTSNTTFYMHYGNSYITSPTENPAGVWDDDYVGVWHLKESGDGTADEYRDSSPYANHGQGGEGDSLFVPTQTGGKIGYGQDFNNSDTKLDLIDVGNHSSLDITGNQITLEAWVQHNITPAFGNSYGILNHKGWSNGYRIMLPDNSTKLAFQLPGSSYNLTSSGDVTAGSWHHLVATYDGSNMKIYIDGSKDTNELAKTDPIFSVPPTENDVWIGHGDQPKDRDWSYEWEGQIDEVRISRVARSQCWVETEYNNQNWPNKAQDAANGFLSTGTEQNLEDFIYRRRIIINRDQVSSSCGSDLSNFPVLIKFENDDELKTSGNGGHVENSNGYDIIFKAADDTTQLEHEVELFDGTNGTLYAWVRIPVLSYTSDTSIYMYYGNNSVSSPTENPANVWESTYRGVWHLNEATGTMRLDSTTNNNDLTDYNGVVLDTNGKSAGAADFDRTLSQSLEIADAAQAGLDITGPVTVEAWVNLGETGNDPYSILFKWRGSCSLGPPYYLRATGGDFGYARENFAVTDDCLNSENGISGSTTSMQAGNWYHVVGVYDGSNIRLYKNGVETNSAAHTTGIFNSDGNLQIGVRGTGQRFDGLIDEVRISSVARDLCWIETQFNNMDPTATFYTVESEQDLTAFAYRKRITIDKDEMGANCGSDLTDFPVLVKIENDNDLKTAPTGHVESANGYDIVFRTSDGLTRLDHEVEDYNGSTGTLIAWVRIPNLSSTSDTTIYMYYGNSTITSPTQNPSGVWNLNYKAVWHLNESGSGAAGEFKDSTQYINHGQGGSGTGTQVPGQVDGVFFKAQNFDGVDDHIDMGNPAALDITSSAITLEAWVQYPSTPAVGGCSGNDCYYGILSKEGYAAGYRFMIGPADQLEFQLTGQSGYEVDSAATMSPGTWYHVVNTYDGTTMRAYINGVKDTNEDGRTGGVDSSANEVWIGAGSDGVGNWWNYPFTGMIDEVRISDTERSQCWIETEYSNQNPSSTFLSVGTEEGLNYAYHKPLTIFKDQFGSSCGADLSNFPVLIKIENDNDLKTAPTGNVESADGYDIIFRASDGSQLDHEIELYDGTNGTLVAWVRIPTLSYTANTTIEMYYGNSGITSPTHNPTGVWGSNYAGVWHLKENGSGAADEFIDSTSNSNHGQGGGGTPGYVPTRTSSHLGYGQTFDGTDDILEIGDPADGSLDMGTSSFSYSVWVNVTSSAGTWDMPWWKGGSSAGTSGYDMELGTGGWEALISDGSTNPNVSFGGEAEFLNDWVQLTAVVDRSTNVFRVYANGSYKGETSISGFGSVSNSGSATIGNDQNNSLNVRFSGIIDEVRVAKFAKDTCWIETEFSNQDSPSTFIGVGTEEGSEAPTENATLANHSAGQETDAFGTGGSVTGAELFAFQLTNTSGSILTVNQVQFQLSSVTGIVQGDFANLAIYVDDNGDGTIDGSDTTGTVGGAGAVDGSVTTITFSTSFDISASATVNYILLGDVNNLVATDTVTIGLGPSNITLASGTVGGTNATSVSHTADSADVYSYRKEITIDHNQIGTSCGADLSDFPALVRIHNDNDLKTAPAGHVESANGYDIVFRASDGLTSLDHEIEYYGPDQVTLSDGWYTGSGPYTVPAFSDRLLVFITGFETADGTQPTITDVTFGGVSMSPASQRAVGTTPFHRIEIWTLKDADIPASGSFSVTYSSAVTRVMHAYALFTNVDQTDPIVDSESGTTTGVTVTTDNPFNVVSGGMSLSGAIANTVDSYDDTLWGSGWREASDQDNAYATMGTAFTASTYGADGTDSATATFISAAGQQVIVATSLRPTSGATLIAWVRIPTLSYTSATTIYMYYGNPAISSPTENPTGVWDTDFKMVQHLRETSGTLYDSTSNDNDGTRKGVGEPAYISSGKIDGAQDSDGNTVNDDYIEVPTNSWSASAGTVEAWVKTDGVTADGLGDYIIGHTTQPPYADRIQIYLYDQNRALAIGLGNNHETHINIQTFAIGTWYHVVLTWDGTNYEVFVDGVSRANGLYSGLSSIYTLADIGNNGNPAARDESWNGIVDEFRVSAIPRDACWIETEYSNQKDSSTLVNVGGEEPSGEAILGEHTAGQETDKFGAGSSVAGAELFAFQLSNTTGSIVTVNQVQFQLSSVTGILDTDFANLAIYVDDNGDGTIDGSDTTGAVGGTGAVDGSVTTITFSTSFDISASATVNYILLGDVNNLVATDTVTIDLDTSDITLASGSVGGTAPTSVSHTADAAGSNLTQIHYRWRNDDSPFWWNSSYLYRKKITVTAGSDDIPSGYSVSVTLDHAALVSASKSLASGDDIRVVYWNGATWTELDRVLDPLSSWNNASTNIWFKSQAIINASSSDDNYYIYYAYSSASNPPDDWANVFMMGDDFNDGTLTTGVTTSTTGTASITETGGEAFIDLGTDELTDAGIIATGSALPSDNRFAIRHKTKVVSGGGVSGPEVKAIGIGESAGAYGVDTNTNENPRRRIISFVRADTFASQIYYYYASDACNYWDGTAWQTGNGWWTGGNLSADTYYIQELISDGTEWYVRISDADGNVLTTTTPIAWASTYDTGNDFWFYWGEVYTNFYYADVKSDWVYVRTYVDPEPTSALGGEESEASGGASWAANEDTKLNGLSKEIPIRLRFEVSNEGTLSSGGATYQLQMAETGTCGSGTYSAVPTDASGHWQIVDSSHITDGEATSNIDPGLTDEATTFVAGQLKDAGNTTGSITLGSDEFTEIEFSVQATTNATAGGDYCFRLYDTTGGSTLNTYSVYGEVSLAGGANLTQIHYRWRNDDGGEGGFSTGTGADGSVTINSSQNINTDILGSNRSTNADGILTSASVNPTGTSITVASTTGFAAGDEILLINMQGVSGDTADVGNYEFLIVDSVPNSTTLNLTTAVQKSYDGSNFGNQTIVVQRVPQWTDVTIQSGGTLTANAWDGTSGGIIVFRATGTVDIQSGGSINVNGLGYVGGNGATVNETDGFQGESDPGTGSQSPVNNAGAGGGGDLTNISGDSCGQGGGGGGYGSAGTVGDYGSLCGGSWPQTNAGITYGIADLSKIYLGSGGGGGAADDNNSSRAGNGAKGAGIVIIVADTINIDGDLQANGGDGEVAPDIWDNGNGGGGSGGSIYLAANSVTLAAGSTTATGGTGGPNTGDPTWNGAGGDGGVGRIRIEADSITGTTSPTASTAGTSGAGATFAEIEDGKLIDLPIKTPIRLRFLLCNQGDQSTGPIAFQLQWAETANCGSGTYSAVATTPPGPSDHWEIVDSSYVSDGEQTFDNAGLTNACTTWVAGQLRDADNATGTITLDPNEFTEIEFALQASEYATGGGDYCFRLYDLTNNTVLHDYSVHAQVQLYEGIFQYRKPITFAAANLGTSCSANSNQVSATADTTTTSATDVLVNGMTITPGAGDYHIWFSGSVESTASSYQYVSLYVNGVQLAHTEREIRTESSIPNTAFPVATHARVTGLLDGQAIEVQWRTTAGTATMHERTLVVSEIVPENSGQVSATADDSTASATDVLVNGMTITPGAGDYHIWFSGSLESSATSYQYVSLYVNGVQLAHTEREIRTEGSIPATSFPVATHARVTGVQNGQAIEVHWRTTAGTATMHQRTFVVSKIPSADSTQASATGDTTTTSTTDVLVNSMTLTPGAGDYYVWFSGSAEGNTGDTTQNVSLYVNGSQIPHTERQIYTEGSILNTSFPVATHARVTGVLAGQAIEVRWRTTAGTATMHQRTLVVSKISATDLTNFPVLISITDTDLRDKARSDGNDIVFRYDDGSCATGPCAGLDHEIEKWNSGTGELTAWVRIPTLSSSSDTTIYMYYGNPSVYEDSQNATGVWSNGYEAVYHMHDDFNDSLGAHNGTNSGSTDVGGQIANGQDFDPNDGVDEVDIGSWSVSGNQLTIQAWIKSDDSFAQNDPRVISKAVSNATQDHVWMMSLTNVDAGEDDLRFRLKTGTDDLAGTTTLLGSIPNATLSDGNSWYLVAMTYDGAQMRIIRDDGIDCGSVAKTGNLRENAWSISIGNSPGNADPATQSWDGKIDEVRISSIARDACWVGTEYNNQSNPAGFYTLGPEEGPGVATAVSLVSFTAKGAGSSVLVEWETAHELNHMGFYLYRAKNPWGPFTRLTDKLISGLTSSVVGMQYSYEDKDVTPGEIYYYKLEDIDIYGKKTLHGPICVDWDGDGLPDDWEIAHGLNPRFDDADFDWDGDGLTNLEEYLRGTDPFNPDTDGDGILDGDEGIERDPADEPIAGTLGPGVYLVESDYTGATLELRTDSFDFTVIEAEGQEFERLNIKDYIHGFTDEVGKPELPLKGILLDIPQGYGATLTVLDTEAETHTGFRVYPVPEKSVDDQDQLAHVGETFVIDEAAYSVDAFYPDAPALLGKEYLFRGQQKQQIFFYPLAFNPATGELRHLRRIRVRVDYVAAEPLSSSGPEPSVWTPPGMEESSLDLSSMVEMAAWEPPSVSKAVYKILVSEEGIYRLTKNWLLAQGLNETDIEAIDLSQVRIYNLGQEIAISVYDEDGDTQFDPEDYIDFYGKAVEETYAKYATDNVYWLTLEGGAGVPKRMAAIDGAPVNVSFPSTHSFTVHHEEDRRYWAKAPGGDSLDRYFFDPYVIGPDVDYEGAGDPVSFKLFLPGVSDNGKGTLKIMMAGTWAPYHQVAVSLNGTPLGTYSWSDIAFYQATIEDVDLVEGINIVTLECLTGVDSIAVDWFEVTYLRSFEANGDTLRFSHETGHLFQVSEFSGNNLLAFDITSPVDVERVINFDITGTGPYTLDFEPEITSGERTYLVLTSDQVKTPVTIIKDVYGNLANPATGADYILVTHRDIGWDVNGDPRGWLNDLTTFRQAQGLRVKVVDVEDVFDEFTYGISTPAAIRDFLAYAYTSWTQPAPQYVLLVGDSTRNPKNNPDPTYGSDSVTTYLPTYLAFTEHMGETATDEWFVRVSGDDGISDLYIGRLPAKSADEATVMANKILAYEASLNTKGWEKNVLLLADDQRDGPEYEYEANFEIMNNEVAALLPAAMHDPFKGYLNDYFDADDLSAEIIARINNGALMVNYSGHSSVQILANHRINYENIFNNADVATLTNSGMYPLFIGMGCLSGHFVYPENWNWTSLAEALLRAEDKGAAAALMSTGLTTTEGQHILDTALVDAIFNQDVRLLGQAVSSAKQVLMANGGSTYEEVNDTFLLFGDPAMALKVPLPQRPLGLRAQGHTGGVLLSWNAATDCNGGPVAGYNLYRSTAPGGPYTKVNTSLITGTQYDDTSVSGTIAQQTMSSAASGTTYYYVVTSVDDQGDESVHSQETSGGTQSANPPANESESSGGGGGGGCFINTVSGE